MDEMIRKLANARQIQAEHKRELADLNAEIQKKYKASLDHVSGLLATATADVRDIESGIRDGAVIQYVATENKHPHPAVTVKQYTVLAYDPGEAFEYCQQYLTAALKMDKRKFEKVAKAAELGFVTIDTEPRATIARDLGAYAGPLWESVEEREAQEAN